MRKILWPLLLAAACLHPFAALAQPAAPLTLERALERASSHSFTLSAARRELDAADGALRQAGTRRNPTLNASVEDTRRETRVTTATLDFPFELGGKRAARVDAAERGRSVALAEFGQADAELRAAVTAAYFTTLIAQERVKLASQSAELASRAADAVARRVQAGKISPVDETRARVDEANARLETAEAGAELEAARQSLAAFWNAPAADFAEVTGDLLQVPDREATAALMPRLDASPALRASRLEVDRRRSLVAVERSRGVPDLTFSVGARRDNEIGHTQAIVAVSIPLPFFDRNQGAVAEADSRARKADDEHEAARIRAATALQQAARRLSLARASVQALQATVLPAAQRAFDAATTGFEAGKFGFLDVIDAQRSLLLARSRHLDALASAHQAAAAIDRLLGH